MKAIEKAIQEGTAEILTLEKVKNLIGKKIQTKYFGYKGQDGIDEFTIEKIVLSHSLWGNQDPEFHVKKAEENPSDYFKKQTIVGTGDYRTCINTDHESDGKFWCSDQDRYVFFIVLD